MTLPTSRGEFESLIPHNKKIFNMEDFKEKFEANLKYLAEFPDVNSLHMFAKRLAKEYFDEKFHKDIDDCQDYDVKFVNGLINDYRCFVNTGSYEGILIEFDCMYFKLSQQEGHTKCEPKLSLPVSMMRTIRRW